MIILNNIEHPVHAAHDTEIGKIDGYKWKKLLF